MPHLVLFREDKEIFTAKNFIHQQPAAHWELLQAIADTLAADGRKAHPLVTQIAQGEWSVLLKEENGDVYTYTLFISRFEEQGTPERKATEKPKTRELVIIDPSGPRGFCWRVSSGLLVD